MFQIQPSPETQTLRELLAPIAWRIRVARRDRQMTWGMIARSAGLRPATVRRCETTAAGLSAARIGRIALALGLDEEELYPGGRPEVFWERVAQDMRRRFAVSRVEMADLPLAA